MKYTKTAKRSARRNKKPLLILTVLVLVIAAGVGAYLYRKRGGEQVATPDTTLPDTEKIDLSPPTEEEKQQVNRRKEEIANQPAAPSTSSVRDVTPTVVDASYYKDDGVFEMRAYINGIYESDGICKLTLTQGSQTVSRESPGFKDAKYTSCTPISIPRSAFSNSGEWSVIVSYQSASAQGSTAAKTVRIE